MESRLAVSQRGFSGTEKSLHAEVDRLITALDQEIEGRAVETLWGDHVTKDLEALQNDFSRKIDNKHIITKDHINSKKGLSLYEFHTEPVSKHEPGNVSPQQMVPDRCSPGARAQARRGAVNMTQTEVRAGLGREVDCRFVAVGKKSWHDARGKKHIDTDLIGKRGGAASTMTATAVGRTGSITHEQVDADFPGKARHACDHSVKAVFFKKH